MWVVAFMAALMLGTAMSTGSEVVETDSGDETDDMDAMGDDGVTPDPVTALRPDVSEDSPEIEIEDGDGGDSSPDPEEEADRETDPDPADDPVVPGIEVVNTGGATVLGSEGNDTLSGETFGRITETTNSTIINLLGGDDVAEVDFGSLFTTGVDGGDGDDTITGATIRPLSLSGGAGDDELSSISAGSIRGGDGDDMISADLSGMFEEDVMISGGLGDDIIRVATQIPGTSSTTDAFAGSAFVTGDEGMDRITLELELRDTALVVDGPTSITWNSNITIDGFDASEDLLQLEITRAEGAEDRAAPVLSLARDEIGTELFGPYTDVTMTFAATATSTEVVSVFRVFSEEAITLDDIVLVEAADPAAAV